MIFMKLILEFLLFNNLVWNISGTQIFHFQSSYKNVSPLRKHIWFFLFRFYGLTYTQNKCYPKNVFHEISTIQVWKMVEKHNFTIYKTVFTIFNAILFDTKPTSFHFIPIQNKKAEADYLNDRMSNHLIDRKIKALMLL